MEAETGKPTLAETTTIPVNGTIGSGPTGNGNRIEDVSEMDRQYLDKMEDEYAKREGGA